MGGPSSRCKPGQGEQTLKAVAGTLARCLGHEKLSKFRSKQRGVFHARCRTCLATLVISQRAWETDGRGYGGSATREECTERMKRREKVGIVERKSA